MRALIVEDNRELAQQITMALEHHGYACDCCHDGEEAWFQGDTETYDIAVLDLGLPGMDGISVLQQWRTSGNEMPVIILTARDTWREKVAGLRAGADDYMAKPFEIEELLARVEALNRRYRGHASPVMQCGDLILDPAQQKVTLSGSPLDLSALEYRLLAYMMPQQGKVISKSELTEHLYHMDFEHQSNVIEVLVNRVRKKLTQPYLKTRRGQGYVLHAPD